MLAGKTSHTVTAASQTSHEVKMNNYDSKCSVDGCERTIGRKGAKGLCSAHYKRLLVGADLARPFSKKGSGWLSSHGYRYIGDKAEHRIIMEKHLGRKLDSCEVVHHIDGDCLNNNISNLMLTYTGVHAAMHTRGKTNEQRAEEKAKYGVCLPCGLGGKP